MRYHAEEEMDSQGEPQLQLVSKYGYVHTFVTIDIPLNRIDIEDSYDLAIIQKVSVYSEDGNLLSQPH